MALIQLLGNVNGDELVTVYEINRGVASVTMPLLVIINDERNARLLAGDDAIDYVLSTLIEGR